MELTFSGLNGIPLVEPEDNIAQLIMNAAENQQKNIAENDVIVIAQKIISKAENRYVILDSVTPSEEAIKLSLEVQKDPRYVELVLRQSNAVIRKKPNVLIVEHTLGFIHANAGMDQSNIEHHEGKERVLLLPVDSDASAEKIRQTIKQKLGVNVGVIINDSMGRAWRNGTLGLAIGVAGFNAVENYIGGQDIFGRELMVTEVAAADEMAAGASLVMGQTQEKTPVVLVRGYQPSEPDDPAQKGVKPLLRPKERDLFR
ncbi:MAG: coenzyme F420-0:L-glutamate ligase [Pseudomonadales bacterium]|nr:coenzyme F420-0:L-glutamate ligase [Pseudomonadales bacterium]